MGTSARVTVNKTRSLDSNAGSLPAGLPSRYAQGFPPGLCEPSHWLTFLLVVFSSPSIRAVRAGPGLSSVQLCFWPWDVVILESLFPNHHWRLLGYQLILLRITSILPSLYKLYLRGIKWLLKECSFWKNSSQ